MPDLAQLERDLGALERDQSLNDDDNLAARFLALKRLDFLGEACRIRANAQPVAGRMERIHALRTALERRNQAFFQMLRSGLRTGTVTPRQLRKLFEDNGSYRPGEVAPLHWGADAADTLAAGLFGSDRPPLQWDGCDREMIHYEPAPVTALLELVDRVPLARADRFVDIGSGLGQAVLLVHLLSGVEAVGLEVMPAFVARARRASATLGIDGVTFNRGDARNADLCSGSVYFLFSPFRGKMLQTVLNRLRGEAAARQLTICSFGPCTERIAAENWLAILEPDMKHEFRLAIFHSRGESNHNGRRRRGNVRVNACP